MKTMWANKWLWAVYLALLGVLLPHTAWAFSRFEPETVMGLWTAWAAAFAFEAAIAVLTQKLARHIEQAPRRGNRWTKWKARYFNAYSMGLLVAVAVSGMANLAHAVEFGGNLVVFGSAKTGWGIPFGVYAVAFGAVLPVVSLLFARVLSNVQDDEREEDEAFVALKDEVRSLKADLRVSEQARENAEARFAAAGDLMRALVEGDKRARILAIRERFPELPGRSIAVLADSSPAYVSEILAEEGHEKE